MSQPEDNGPLASPTPLDTAEIDRVRDFYDVTVIDRILPNARGLINITVEINSDLFLTMFHGRSMEQLDAVAEVTNGMPGTVPIARPRQGRTGYALELSEGPALLVPRLPGSHYVGQAHTDKRPIPARLHQAFAPFFWRVQEGLSAAAEEAKYLLDKPSRDTKNTVPETPPESAEPLMPYAPPDDLPVAAYPDLIHDDFERQNLLSVKDRVTGLVDLDSIRQGDVLYEFGHFIFNLAFCDPRADLATARPYIESMRRAEVIDPEHFHALYAHIYNFAVSDIVDFEDLNATPGLSPDRQTDIGTLVRQYARALSLARDFFRQEFRSDI